MGLSHGLPCSLQLQKVSIMGLNELSNENVFIHKFWREKGRGFGERERERDGRSGVSKEEQVRGNLKHIIEVDLIRELSLGCGSGYDYVTLSNKKRNRFINSVVMLQLKRKFLINLLGT